MEEINQAVVQHLTTAQKPPANIQEVSRTSSELVLVMEIIATALAEFKIFKDMC